MRLNSKEVEALRKAFRETLSFDYRLYLFGSRTDDAKKGGDIDLLVITDVQMKDSAVNLKSAIRRKVYKQIPEQKIDITVATADEIQRDEFLSAIFPTALSLEPYETSMLFNGGVAPTCR